MLDVIAYLLKNKGQRVTLKQALGASAYTPASGYTAPVINEHEVIAALLNYKNSERNGTSIQQSDRKAVISAKGLGIVPKIGDKVRFSSTDYAVLDVHHLHEGETIVAYVCQVRV